MAMRKRFSATLALLALLRAAPASALEWKQPAGEELSLGLLQPALVPLPDGRTLVVGGLTGALNALAPVAEAYLIDPAASQPIQAVAPMSTARHGHTATLLPGGRVLVAGGHGAYPGTDALGSAEIYDPATNTWTPAETLGAARAFHSATVLPGGRVLLLGGVSGATTLDSAESFDPFAKDGAGKWNGVAPMKIGNDSLGRAHHTATELADGRILVAGGTRGNGATQDVLLLDLQAPSGQPWSKAANIGQNRAGHTAVRLRGGQVVLVGGCSNTPSFTISNDPQKGCVAENGLRFYTPGKNSWGTLGGPAPAGLGGRIAVGLRNGWLLVAGGRYASPPEGNGLVEKAVSFLQAPGASEGDPGDGSAPLSSSWPWSNEDPSSLLTLRVNRAFAGVTVDQKGRVLVVGGLKDGNAQKTFEFLDYLDNGADCPTLPDTPLACASGVCVDGVCCDRRCDSACGSCLASKTNLGKDGICGASVQQEVSTGCRLPSATCSGNSIDQGKCSGGVCVPDLQDCGFYKCQSGKACPSSCSSISDCNTLGSPDVTCATSGQTKTCGPHLASGAACKNDDECASEHCEPGAPPSPAVPFPSSICCAEPCAPPQCDGDSAGIIFSYCDGLGASCKQAYQYCNGYRCSSFACLTKCNFDTDCAATHHCSGNVCSERKPLGSACEIDSECLPIDDKKTYCVEGICCDTNDCDTKGCHSCRQANNGAQEGLCLPVTTGTDPHEDCADETGVNPCGLTGACGGDGKCAFVPADKECKASLCQANRLSVYTCNGNGTCQEKADDCPGNSTCNVAQDDCQTGCATDADCTSNWACVEGRCATECGARRDCKAGYNCSDSVPSACIEAATCVDEGTLRTVDGKEQPCRAGRRCNDEAPKGALSCTEACQSTLDCIDGYVCSTTGDCRQPPAGVVDETECYCAQPGRPAPSSAAGLLLLAALAARPLRRASRRAGS